MTDRQLRGVVAVAFTLSGFAALAYQIAWQRVLTQVIGSDAISIVFVVTIFMACLGAGAEIARQLLSTTRVPFAFLYAFIELAVGLYGFISIPLMRAANSWWASLGPSSIVADAALNFAVLALPVIGMGMTTPLIIHLARERLDNLGRTVGWLYGLNMFGAAIGALVAGVALIELVGLRGTTILAAGLNVAVGISLFVVLRARATPLVEPAALSETLSLGHASAALAFGFGTLALQIALFRVLANYFTLATIVFPILLCAYLLLMSAGQWLGGRLADRFPLHLPTTLAALFAAGSLLLLLSMRFPPALAANFGALAFTSFNGSLLSSEWSHLIGDPNPAMIFLFGAFLMLPVLFLSALFPVMMRLMTERVESAGKSFARLYVLYTVGNVLGTFIFGLWLLPWLKTGPSLTATVCVVAFGVLTIAGLSRARPVALVSVGVAAAMLIPANFYQKFRLGTYAVENVYEGQTGVATTIPTDRFYKIIDMNRTASASAMVRDPGPHDAYEAWRWNHTELLALDAAFRPRRILVIGIGHAYLIDALLDLPFVESIDIVDISAEIITAVRDNTLTSTKRIFSDPRVRIHTEDGRRFVQQALASGVKYDLIQNKINEPWHAGAGNLFTVEFMQMERDLLSEGGYLGTRPLIGHLRDGLHIFEQAVYPGYYHLFFKNGPLPKFDQALIKDDIFQAWNTALPGHGAAPREQTNLKVAVFDRASILPDIDANTDDHPTFEYYKFRQWTGKWVSPRVSLDAPQFDQFMRDVPLAR